MFLRNVDNTGRQNLFLLPAKMNGDLYGLDVAESKYSNQNALLPTILQGERFKSTSTFLINKKINTF
jgi:hypothetical protein